MDEEMIADGWFILMVLGVALAPVFAVTVWHLYRDFTENKKEEK